MGITIEYRILLTYGKVVKKMLPLLKLFHFLKNGKTNKSDKMPAMWQYQSNVDTHRLLSL